MNRYGYSIRYDDDPSVGGHTQLVGDQVTAVIHDFMLALPDYLNELNATAEKVTPSELSKPIHHRGLINADVIVTTTLDLNEMNEVMREFAARHALTAIPLSSHAGEKHRAP